jgi:hypothetical protein
MSGEETSSGLIGARLESLRQQLMSCGHVLAGLVEPAARPLIADALVDLKQLVCRIGVVGQIKSGKSSFINTFVQHPNFLPTSVTPWTTAVTNLHFAQTPPGPHSAIFTFLQPKEWNELADSGGKIRELTERLVPGFEPSLLQQQAELLRNRARDRLGPEYDLLLGQAHCFISFAPSTLQHYVCSGDFSAQPGTVPIGKYSDITKSADLYFQRGPFAFPSTVVDTPGTNDPFLIRDEITRRSLGSADIYVVVLTARQPLSDTDVTLLRIMRGLNKDRIVVLLNRIDDLTDVDAELPRVLHYVRQKLAAELPGAEIPLVHGSAWWGGQAMTYDREAVSRILKRRSAHYLLRAGLLRPEELDPRNVGNPDFDERLRHSLLAMSGLPAVYQAIDGLMDAASPTYVMRQITGSFAEMSRACEGAARSELQSLQAAAEKRELPLGTGEKFVELAKESELLARVAANIEASASGIEQQLVRIIQEEKETLRRKLQATIDFHAARERDVLIDTLSRGRAPRVWTHEGVELRRALAETFRDGFRSAASRLTSFHARVAPELHQLMSSLVPGAVLPDPHGQTLAIPEPTIAPVSRMMALDLDTSRWSLFWSRNPSPQASGSKIEALIQSEFASVADELVHLAGGAFHHFSTTTIKWSLGACRNIQQALQRRYERVRRDYELAQREAFPPESPEEAKERAERINAQAQRVKDNETLTQHLEHLIQYIDTVLKCEAPRAT